MRKLRHREINFLKTSQLVSVELGLEHGLFCSRTHLSDGDLAHCLQVNHPMWRRTPQSSREALTFMIQLGLHIPDWHTEQEVKKRTCMRTCNYTKKKTHNFYFHWDNCDIFFHMATPSCRVTWKHSLHLGSLCPSYHCSMSMEGIGRDIGNN